MNIPEKTAKEWR